MRSFRLIPGFCSFIWCRNACYSAESTLQCLRSSPFFVSGLGTFSHSARLDTGHFSRNSNWLFLGRCYRDLGPAMVKSDMVVATILAFLPTVRQGMPKMVKCDVYSKQMTQVGGILAPLPIRFARLSRRLLFCGALKV